VPISDMIDVRTEPVGMESPGLFRVKMVCSHEKCTNWGVAWPALPTSNVTVTQVLQAAAEHVDRVHPLLGEKMPDVPILNQEDPREPVIAPAGGRADAISPLGQ